MAEPATLPPVGVVVENALSYLRRKALWFPPPSPVAVGEVTCSAHAVLLLLALVPNVVAAAPPTAFVLFSRREDVLLPVLPPASSPTLPTSSSASRIRSISLRNAWSFARRLVVFGHCAAGSSVYFERHRSNSPHTSSSKASISAFGPFIFLYFEEHL